jgi:hypothetical protein
MSLYEYVRSGPAVYYDPMGEGLYEIGYDLLCDYNDWSTRFTDAAFATGQNTIGLAVDVATAAGQGFPQYAGDSSVPYRDPSTGLESATENRACAAATSFRKDPLGTAAGVAVGLARQVDGVLHGDPVVWGSTTVDLATAKIGTSVSKATGVTGTLKQVSATAKVTLKSAANKITTAVAKKLGDVASKVDDAATNTAQRSTAAMETCFPEGTVVATEDGPEVIEDIAVGRMVWACDTETGVWQLWPVAARMVHEYCGDVIRVSVARDEIEATTNHPFWVVVGEDLARRSCSHDVYAHGQDVAAQGGWVEAGSLRVGDVLLVRDGSAATVERISSRRARLIVYNITVESLHTYAVGASGTLVHNKPVRNASNAGGFENMPRGNNVAANARVKYIVKKLGLTKSQGQQLHRAISKQGYTLKEIGHIAEDMFGKGK